MNSDRVPRIAVYAGPTGGHLFPAQAFAECLRKKMPDARLELITSCRGKKLIENIPESVFDRVHYLPEFGLPHKVLSFGWLKPLCLAPYLFLQALMFLLFRKPGLCIGFGSFVAYPGMIMARWLGIPTLIHEQNRVPGKATCWLAPHMSAVAVSFEGTKLPAGTKKIRTTGLPLRSSITDHPARERNRGGKINILVMGGSQGAMGLNRIVVEAFSRLSREEREKIAVTHITGEKDREWVVGQYGAARLPFDVRAYCRDMFELFQRTDLAITRAGANTLFELAFYGIPAFVIPFPHAGGHQKLNADAFAAEGGLEYHEETPDAVEWLASKLGVVLSGGKGLEQMAKAMSDLAKPRASEDLVTIALGLVGKNEDHQ